MATVEQILMVKGPDVIVAAPSNTVFDAAKMMAEANVGSVIIKDGGHTEGIFTERDLLCRVIALRKDASTTTLAEVMSSPIKACGLDDEVHEVANMLTMEHIRHLAVIEGDALIGVIGLRDLLTAELRETEEKLKQYQVN